MARRTPIGDPVHNSHHDRNGKKRRRHEEHHSRSSGGDDSGDDSGDSKRHHKSRSSHSKSRDRRSYGGHGKKRRHLEDHHPRSSGSDGSAESKRRYRSRSSHRRDKSKSRHRRSSGGGAGSVESERRHKSSSSHRSKSRKSRSRRQQIKDHAKSRSFRDDSRYATESRSSSSGEESTESESVGSLLSMNEDKAGVDDIDHKSGWDSAKERKKRKRQSESDDTQEKWLLSRGYEREEEVRSKRKLMKSDSDLEKVEREEYQGGKMEEGNLNAEVVFSVSSEIRTVRKARSDKLGRGLSQLHTFYSAKTFFAGNNQPVDSVIKIYRPNDGDHSSMEPYFKLLNSFKDPSNILSVRNFSVGADEEVIEFAEVHTTMRSYIQSYAEYLHTPRELYHVCDFSTLTIGHILDIGGQLGRVHRQGRYHGSMSLSSIFMFLDDNYDPWERRHGKPKLSFPDFEQNPSLAVQFVDGGGADISEEELVMAQAMDFKHLGSLILEIEGEIRTRNPEIYNVVEKLRSGLIRTYEQLLEQYCLMVPLRRLTTFIRIHEMLRFNEFRIRGFDKNTWRPLFDENIFDVVNRVLKETKLKNGVPPASTDPASNEGEELVSNEQVEPKNNSEFTCGKSERNVLIHLDGIGMEIVKQYTGTHDRLMRRFRFHHTTFFIELFENARHATMPQGVPLELYEEEGEDRLTEEEREIKVERERDEHRREQFKSLIVDLRSI